MAKTRTAAEAAAIMLRYYRSLPEPSLQTPEERIVCADEKLNNFPSEVLDALRFDVPREVDMQRFLIHRGLACREYQPRCWTEEGYFLRRRLLARAT